MKKRPSPAAVLAATILAGSVAACAQLVGASFDDVHPGEPGSSGASGSSGGSDQDGAGPSGSSSGGGSGGSSGSGGGSGSSSGGTPDGGTPIDDGGTVFVDASCGPGATTSISGTVYDPAGTTPLYDALVYVPTAGLAPVTRALACDRCGAAPSGGPMAIALTGPDGKFTLHGVPAGTGVPLVVQVGQWRRLVHMPSVQPCVDNAITDANLTRLPRNGGEGDMPRIAVVTGQGDSVECVLLKMGIDASEFTAPGGGGHVELYQENGGYVGSPTAPDGGTQAWDLYGSVATMAQYDQILFGCDANPTTRNATFAQNLAAYADQGGRVWFEHYELDWLQAMPNGYSGAITFSPDSTATSPSGTIDVTPTFPKAAALGAWMTTIGQSSVANQFSAPDTRGDIVSTTGHTWMTVTGSIATGDGGTASATIPEAVSFNTPVGASASSACGRVVFSDFHAGELSQALTLTFPAECPSTPLTAEGHAIEFALFDLGACVMDDDATPTAP